MGQIPTAMSVMKEIRQIPWTAPYMKMNLSCSLETAEQGMLAN